MFMVFSKRMNVNPYPYIGTTCLIEAIFLFYMIQADLNCMGHSPWFNIGDWEAPRALIHRSELLQTVFKE
jgi:hypothetical protein